MNWLPFPLPGLRARILAAVAVTTSITMMLLSWGMLYSWKASLIDQEERNVLAVSRAFSVAVIDALIFSDQDLYQSEGFLDNYVTMFMKENPRLRAITILSPHGDILARSWDSKDPPWVSGSLASILAVPGPRTSITTSASGAWLLETLLPMRTGDRPWGVLVVDVEADSIRTQIRRSFIQLALFSISVTSILLLLLWLMLSRILNVLQVLVLAMDTLDINTTPTTELPERRDEIGLLFKRFQNMQARLDQSRKDLLAAQRQVWHAERLASIGRLASGLAHEINNPINGVRNCIYAIRGDLDNQTQTIEYLDMMDEGLTSASGVLTKLLGYSRKQQSGPGLIQLNEAVKTVLRLVSFNLERKGVTMDSFLAPELPRVLADRQLIQEVIMNLLINATDASHPGDVIRISTSVSGTSVMLAISDQGPGIEPEDLDRIFDPFFTTKKPGEGTGLGLSICLSIVQAAGGSIDVDSRPGQGATFTIALPIARPDRNEDQDT
jgi:signal transduction histidine kinase|nr:ATP-binding protein [Candidatus Krumholzibacteria bacterium]